MVCCVAEGTEEVQNPQRLACYVDEIIQRTKALRIEAIR